MTVKLGIFGAGGRMGREIVNLVIRDPRARLAGAVEAAGHASVGAHLAGGVTICSNPLALAHAAQVLIDFTTPDALVANLNAACSARRAIIIGTTGLAPAHMKAIDAVARHVPVLQAANTSLGVTLLAAFVEQAAARLGAGWDVEVLELHHALKADAPSGTALMLGAAVATGRGEAAPPAKARTAARVAGEIGYASLRGGTSAGEHSVLFLGDGERLELTHRSENRAIFARGALEAALWLNGKPAGRYTMRDIVNG